MINLVNTPYMTLDERHNSLRRALRSQCFFNLLEFGALAVGPDMIRYGATSQVDKDFWATVIMANYGEVYQTTLAFFNLSLYIANRGQSLWRYIAGELLPSQLQVSDIVEQVTLNNTGTSTVDKQREILPRLIKRGDNLIAYTRNIETVQSNADLQLVVAGYHLFDRPHLPERTKKGINESLNKNIEFDQWTFDVDFEGNDIRVLNNDRFARMILGFAIVDNEKAALHGAQICDSTFLITDVYRNIKFSNVPLNSAFFAPKTVQTQDVSIYYLPIEHFWQPFAPLKFEIANALNGSTGYQLIMLTRTV